jgi:hypothetical protein
MLCLVGVIILGNFAWPGSEVQAKSHKTSNSASVYKVRSGDNLSVISHKLKIPLSQLKKLNQLKSDKLDIGQLLKISTQSAKSKSNQQIKAKSISTTTRKNADLKRKTKVSRSLAGERVVGELLTWPEANKLFEQGMIVKVFDVASGQTIKVKRNYGHNHADVDPLTKDDTDIIRGLYGGSWSWDRRAVILEIDGKLVAASMNGMPHGNKIVNNNGFPGHFCIHFLGSKTHGSSYTRRGVPIVDEQHQAMVRKAAGL